MKNKLEISISKACKENWNKFDKDGAMGFCGRCQKNVIDFTVKSDREIIAYLDLKPKGVCGRFRPEQLKTYRLKNEGKGLSKPAIIAASILSLAQVGKSVAQKINIENTTEMQLTKPYSTDIGLPSIKVDTTLYTIKGQIYSIEEEYEIPGVDVTIKGTEMSTSTDLNGSFKLTYTGDSKKITLVICSIGYKTIERQIELKENFIEIGKVDMTMDNIILGEVIYYNKLSPKGIWQRFRNIF